MERETVCVAWLLDSSHRNENKEEQVEESILRVMYISISTQTCKYLSAAVNTSLDLGRATLTLCDRSALPRCQRISYLSTLPPSEDRNTFCFQTLWCLCYKVTKWTKSKQIFLYVVARSSPNNFKCISLAVLSHLTAAAPGVHTWPFNNPLTQTVFSNHIQDSLLEQEFVMYVNT